MDTTLGKRENKNKKIKKIQYLFSNELKFSANSRIGNPFILAYLRMIIHLNTRDKKKTAHVLKSLYAACVVASFYFIHIQVKKGGS